MLRRQHTIAATAHSMQEQYIAASARNRNSYVLLYFYIIVLIIAGQPHISPDVSALGIQGPHQQLVPGDLGDGKSSTDMRWRERDTHV